MKKYSEMQKYETDIEINHFFPLRTSMFCEC